MARRFMGGRHGVDQRGAVKLCNEKEAGMAEASERHTTQDIGSGTAGEPGVAYDPDRVGEPVPPGVPTGDQYPTNERDNISTGGHGGAGIIDDPPGTRPAGES